MAKEIDLSQPESIWLHKRARIHKLVKAVNVTEDCPGCRANEEVHLLFIKQDWGDIADILVEIFSNIGGHFKVCLTGLDDELDNKLQDPVDSFGIWAKHLGMTKAELIAHIKKCAPSI